MRPVDTIPPRRARSRLEGGAVSKGVLDSSAGVLHRAGDNSHFKGLQQFFSPPEASTLAYRAFTDAGRVPPVLDPTAGDGALLPAFPKDKRYGIEIDADHAGAGRYTANRR